MELGENATVRLDADKEFQPDALLRIDAEVDRKLGMMIMCDRTLYNHRSVWYLVRGAMALFLLKHRFPSNPRIIIVEIE